jgi:hypothetical protein
MKPLLELASVIRTKNAGPYELTIDVIFNDRRTYEQAKRENSLNASLIAGLYGIAETDVLTAIYFDPACAFKATMKRKIPCGDFGEKDIYGAQQHAPLLDLVVQWGDKDADQS